jgi:hypothetical protein
MQRFASEVNSSPDLKALPKDRVGHATSLLVDNNKGKRQEKKNSVRARSLVSFPFAPMQLLFQKGCTKRMENQRIRVPADCLDVI